jgi:hypothetical protein
MESNMLAGLLMAGAVVSSGCGGSAGTGATGAPDAGATDATGTMDASNVDAVTIGIFGAVITFGGSGDGMAVEGVQVCVNERPDIPCAKTDAAGTYAIRGVPGTTGEPLESVMVFSLDGFVSSALPILIADKDIAADTPLLSNLLVTIFHGEVGAAWPLVKNGDLAITTSTKTYTNWQDGVSAVIEPKSGTGPNYSNPESGLPDTTLTATSTSGDGAFTQVTPGVVEVTFSHATLHCSKIVNGWPSTKPDSLRAPVLAGHLTYTAILCDP